VRVTQLVRPLRADVANTPRPSPRSAFGLRPWLPPDDVVRRFFCVIFLDRIVLAAKNKSKCTGTVLSASQCRRWDFCCCGQSVAPNRPFPFGLDPNPPGLTQYVSRIRQSQARPYRRGPANPPGDFFSDSPKVLWLATQTGLVRLAMACAFAKPRHYSPARAP